MENYSRLFRLYHWDYAKIPAKVYNDCAMAWHQKEEARNEIILDMFSSMVVMYGIIG